MVYCAFCISPFSCAKWLTSWIVLAPSELAINADSFSPTAFLIWNSWFFVSVILLRSFELIRR